MKYSAMSSPWITVAVVAAVNPQQTFLVSAMAVLGTMVIGLVITLGQE